MNYTKMFSWKACGDLNGLRATGRFFLTFSCCLNQPCERQTNLKFCASRAVKWRQHENVVEQLVNTNLVKSLNLNTFPQIYLWNPKSRLSRRSRIKACCALAIRKRRNVLVTRKIIIKTSKTQFVMILSQGRPNS